MAIRRCICGFKFRDARLWIRCGKQRSHGCLVESTNADNSGGVSGAWVRLKREVLGSSTLLSGELDVTNPGTRTAPPTVIKFFFSADPVLGRGAGFLAQLIVGELKPGQTRRVRFHRFVQGSAAGRFVIAVLDATNLVPELDEANNKVVFGPIP